jgi:hypothetical protein
MGDGLGKPFAQILDSIVHLRHTAVHRLRISANRLEQFMIDAEALVRLLRDDYCRLKLTRLRMDTQLTIGELKRNKDLLESKVTSEALRDTTPDPTTIHHHRAVATAGFPVSSAAFFLLAPSHTQLVKDP